MKRLHLYGQYGIGKYCLIDNEDYERIKEYGKWMFVRSSNGRFFYVRKLYKGKWIALHRTLMNASKGQIIDHKNGNTLDNRRTNLRFCTYQQNNYNVRLRGNKSLDGNGKRILKGVTYCPKTSRKKPWKAQIKYNKKNYHLGLFKTQREAHAIYLNKLNEFAGEFARP